VREDQDFRAPSGGKKKIQKISYDMAPLLGGGCGKRVGLFEKKGKVLKVALSDGGKKGRRAA